MTMKMNNVKPLDLNCFSNMSDEQRQHVVEFLDPMHGDMVNEGCWPEDLVCGLEYILQGLGAAGYEFT